MNGFSFEKVIVAAMFGATLLVRCSPDWQHNS